MVDKNTSNSNSVLKDKIAQACIAIVDRERVNWEDAVSFITPKVGFRMRELVRIFRKNYWGVFDSPIDKNTGREKIWIGLIMSLVETWVKNIDLDQKDIGFIARNPNGYDITELTRLVVKDYLDRIYFGEILDSDERQVLIDGTVVWKTWETKVNGKTVMNRRTPDLLNIYIDPTEDSIQSAYRFTERAIMLPSQIEAMSGWMNTDDLPGSQVLNRVDGSRRSNFGTKTTGEYRDVWEMWGKIPQWLITGDENADDAMEEIDGHIIISGLEAPEPKLHLVEENKRKDKFGNTIKPYEEWRACKISGRWYGLGVAERALALQEYLNTIINTRITRHTISQLGLFSIIKGKGITPQMLSRLSANGALQVQQHTDIQPLAIPQDDGTSYKDEEIIKYWSQQITSAMPISNGEIMPASSTATANAIANTSAKTAYTLFKEGTGSFLERWIDRGALPIISKTIKQGDLVRLTNDDDRYKSLIETIAVNNVADHLDNSNVVPTEEEMMNELEKEKDRLRSKPGLFIENLQELVASELDTKVQITNEEIDTTVTIQNLLQMAQIAPEYKDSAIKQVYDLMGLAMPKKTDPQMQPQPGQQGQQIPGMPQPNMQNITQQAMLPK